MRWRWHHGGEEEGRGGSRWTSSLGGSPPGDGGGGEEEGGDGEVMVMKKRRVTLANLHGDELGAVGHHVQVCPHALVLGEHLKVFIVSM